MKDMIKWDRPCYKCLSHYCDLSCKETLAKQEQGEPVGEMQLSAIIEGTVVPVVPFQLPVGTKLYTTPQQRKPLTDEQIEIVHRSTWMQSTATLKDFARAIEAAHGIKGEV
jgi:hypothetical protein